MPVVLYTLKKLQQKIVFKLKKQLSYHCGYYEANECNNSL